MAASYAAHTGPTAGGKRRLRLTMRSRRCHDAYLPWHFRPARLSRSCSPTSKGPHGSSAPWVRRPGPRWSGGTTRSSGRRSRVSAESWSRPRATHSSRPSTLRSRPSRLRSQHSGPWPTNRGRMAWPSRSGWGSISARDACGRASRRRAGGLRRDRRQLRSPDRGGGERRADRPVRPSRGDAAARLTRLAGLADVELVDDGPRAVKDFEDPVPLYRLVVPGAADDPRPLRTTEVPRTCPARSPPSSAGRTRSTASGMISSPAGSSPWPGPAAAARPGSPLPSPRSVRDLFPHGVWFVDLAALRDPDLLEPAIAVALDVRETPDRTASEALRAHLRERTVLLVLDNLEQLLPAAAGIVAGLVRAAPGLRTLVTSRELLRIAGERGHPVPPLDGEGAVALFVDRARAQRSDFAATGESLAAIQEICRRLDGLPLAIELAAARVRLLSPAAILDRLGRSLDLGSGPRDTPERQRTLRGTFDWSYELLPDEERRLFSRLAVFAGSWTPAMAAAVADPDDDLGHRSRGRPRVAGRQEPRPGRARRRGRVERRGRRSGSASIPCFANTVWSASEDAGERSLAEARFGAVCVGVAEAAGRGDARSGPGGEHAAPRSRRSEPPGRDRLDDRQRRGATLASGWSARSGAGTRRGAGSARLGRSWPTCLPAPRKVAYRSGSPPSPPRVASPTG